MDLSNIVSADIKRLDQGPVIYVEITLNLASGGPWKVPGGFYLSPDDIADFKGGTPAQKQALRKKYIRQAIRNYLDAVVAMPAMTDAGTATATKAQISDPGDT